jgi:hypothetical protein
LTIIGKLMRMWKIYNTKSLVRLLELSGLLLALSLGGCRSPQDPHLRISSYFGSVGPMQFVDPNNLGRHSYYLDHQLGEVTGMVYTCRAGFIDLGHLREAADRTAHVYRLVYQNIMQGDKEFSFRVIEPSVYHLSLDYPPQWSDLSAREKQAIARQMALKLGREIAHTSLIWHEMITWFGFASSGLFPEQISSFSWEDPYSDALGTVLAVQALSKGGLYDQTMTDLINKKLRELEVQPPHVAHQAYKKVEGQWFAGGLYFFVKMNKRNFDVGLANQQLIPWLVPGMCLEAQPEPCLVPRVQTEDLFGFTIELTLDPRIMEKAKIYDWLALQKNQRLKPSEHFPLLLDKIVEDARRQYGPPVDAPILDGQAHGDPLTGETNAIQ